MDSLLEVSSAESYPVAGATVYDIETFPNFILFAFLEPDGCVREFRATPDEALDASALADYTDGRLLVGFNSNHFDDHLLGLAIQGAGVDTLYQRAQAIIGGQLPRSPGGGLRTHPRSIDLFEVLGGAARAGSLKLLAARMGCTTLQELPFDPTQALSPEQVEAVAAYCRNDLAVTSDLYRHLNGALAVRQSLSRQYAIDLRSRSDAAIAEEVLCREYERRTGFGKDRLRRMVERPKTIRYVPPKWAAAIRHPATRDWLELLEQPITIDEKGRPDAPHLQRTIRIAGGQYATGIGGLHSQHGTGIYREDDDFGLLDADVTSEYPSIIVQQQLHPAHLLPVFTDIVAELLNRRVSAKRAGDRETADALKIVVNSLFGKTGSLYSPLYDPAMMTAVTLTGQLALLLLIERLEDAGGEVLAANTDGVTIRYQRQSIERVRAVLRAWQDTTGLELETNAYRLFAQKDVNNYLAADGLGRIKTKGAFLNQRQLSKNVSAAVVAQAVAAWLVEGVPIADTIAQATDLRDFCYIHQSRSPVHCGEIPLGKVVRWYRSTGLTVPFIKVGASGRRSKLPDSDGAAPAQRLPATLPDDLDRNYYVRATETLLRTLDPHPPGDRNVRAAELRRRGFSPYPMNGRYNLKGVAKTKVFDARYDFTDIPNLATQTGPKVGLIAIDIDHPDRLPVSLKGLLSKHPTSTCWHGVDLSAESVRSGGCRGKLFYAIPPRWFPRHKVARLDDLGIEVFSGHPVTVEGPYPKEPDQCYQLSEDPIGPLPDALHAWLAEHMYPGLSCGAAIEETGETVADERLADVLRHVPELKLDYLPAKRAYVGPCPHPHRHPGARDFFVAVVASANGPRLVARCVHGTCPASDALHPRLKALWAQMQEINVEAAATVREPADDEEPEDLDSALRSDALAAIVVAPTGAGKSYSSAKLFLETLHAGQYPVFIAATKADQDQFVDLITQLAGVETIAELPVAVLKREAGTLEEPETTPTTGSINVASYGGLITHRTYFGRKGHSDFFYATLEQLAQVGRDLVILIDEVDAWLDALTLEIPLDARYLLTPRHGAVAPTVRRTTRCPGAARQGDCRCCDMQRDHLFGRVNAQQIFTFVQPPIPDPPADYMAIDSPPIQLGQAAGVYVFQFQEVITHPRALESMQFNRRLRKKDIYDGRQILINRIEESWRPRVVSHLPLLDGQPVSPDELRVLLQEPKNKPRIQYPNAACEVRTLMLPDLAPLYWLARSGARLRFLTATLDATQHAMIEAGLGRAIPCYRLDLSERRIDEIAVLVLYGRFPLTSSDAVKALSELPEATIIFTPRKSEACEYFQLRHVRAQALYVDRESHWEEAGLQHGRPRLLWSYARSGIGRGINLQEFGIVLTDLRAFKPAAAALCPSIEPEQVAAALIEDRNRTVIQNAGRILRRRHPDGMERRVVVLHHPRFFDGQGRPAKSGKPEDLTDIIHHLASRAERCVVETFLDRKALIAGINEFFATGTVTAEPAPDGRKLSRSKRATAKVIRKDEQRDWARRKAREALQECRRQGQPWRDAYKRVHLNRYFEKQEIERLKAWYEASYEPMDE